MFGHGCNRHILVTSTGSDGRGTPVDLWMPPVSWGSAEEPGDRPGIVCFITPLEFLNWPGFHQMRQGSWQSYSEIRVIVCSPDRHHPAVNTRLFAGVQQKICMVLAARRSGIAPGVRPPMRAATSILNIKAAVSALLTASLHLPSSLHA